MQHLLPVLRVTKRCCSLEENLRAEHFFGSDHCRVGFSCSGESVKTDGLRNDEAPHSCRCNYSSYHEVLRSKLPEVSSWHLFVWGWEPLSPFRPPLQQKKIMRHYFVWIASVCSYTKIATPGGCPWVQDCRSFLQLVFGFGPLCQGLLEWLSCPWPSFPGSRLCRCENWPAFQLSGPSFHTAPCTCLFYGPPPTQEHLRRCRMGTQSRRPESLRPILMQYRAEGFRPSAVCAPNRLRRQKSWWIFVEGCGQEPSPWSGHGVEYLSHDRLAVVEYMGEGFFCMSASAAPQVGLGVFIELWPDLFYWKEVQAAFHCESALCGIKSVGFRHPNVGKTVKGVGTNCFTLVRIWGPHSFPPSVLLLVECSGEYTPILRGQRLASRRYA